MSASGRSALVVDPAVLRAAVERDVSGDTKSHDNASSTKSRFALRPATAILHEHMQAMKRPKPLLVTTPLSWPSSASHLPAPPGKTASQASSQKGIHKPNADQAGFGSSLCDSGEAVQPDLRETSQSNTASAGATVEEATATDKPTKPTNMPVERQAFLTVVFVDNELAGAGVADKVQMSRHAACFDALERMEDQGPLKRAEAPVVTMQVTHKQLLQALSSLGLAYGCICPPALLELQQSKAKPKTLSVPDAEAENAQVDDAPEDVFKASQALNEYRHRHGVTVRPSFDFSHVAREDSTQRNLHKCCLEWNPNGCRHYHVEARAFDKKTAQHLAALKLLEEIFKVNGLDQVLKACDKESKERRKVASTSISHIKKKQQAEKQNEKHTNSGHSVGHSRVKRQKRASAPAHSGTKVGAAGRSHMSSHRLLIVNAEGRRPVDRFQQRFFPATASMASPIVPPDAYRRQDEQHIMPSIGAATMRPTIPHYPGAPFTAPSRPEQYGGTSSYAHSVLSHPPAPRMLQPPNHGQRFSASQHTVTEAHNRGLRPPFYSMQSHGWPSSQ